MSSLATPARPVKSRKPRTPPTRSIRLLVALNQQGRNAVARITVGKHESDYFVDCLTADVGTAFAVEKIGGTEEERYAVNLNGDQSSCECKGFLRWGHHASKTGVRSCKHIDGLTALVSAGKL